LPANRSLHLVLGDGFDPSNETAIAGPGKGGKQLERLDERVLHDVLRIHVLSQLVAQPEANPLRDARPQGPDNLLEGASVAALGAEN
jgi:hypothetical protein